MCCDVRVRKPGLVIRRATFDDKCVEHRARNAGDRVTLLPRRENAGRADISIVGKVRTDRRARVASLLRFSRSSEDEFCSKSPEILPGRLL